MSYQHQYLKIFIKSPSQFWLELTRLDSWPPPALLSVRFQQISPPQALLASHVWWSVVLSAVLMASFDYHNLNQSRHRNWINRGKGERDTVREHFDFILYWELRRSINMSPTISSVSMIFVEQHLFLSKIANFYLQKIKTFPLKVWWLFKLVWF